MARQWTALMLALGMLCALLLSGCGLPSGPEVPVESTPNTQTMGGTTYIWEGRDEGAVQRADALLAAARDFYGMMRTPKTVTFTETGATSVQTSTITFNRYDAYALGAFFCYASFETLPAWLAAGLELYWLEHEGHNGPWPEADIAALTAKLPPVCDGWFIPGFLPDGPDGDALYVLRAFIMYLEDQGQLKSLVALYRDTEAQAEADALYREAWRVFSGREADETGYRYLYGKGIVITTARGRYTFKEAVWPLELMNDRVAFMDSCIAYAFDWFEIEQPTPVPVTLEPDNAALYGVGGVTGVTLHGALEAVPFAMTHEVSHYIACNHGLMDGFAVYIREGLPEAVAYHHAMADADFRAHFLRGGANMGYLDIWRPESQAVITGLSGITIHSDGEIEPMSLSKLQALWSIADMTYFGTFPPLPQGGLLGGTTTRVANTWGPLDRPEGVLYTYYTAADFTLFLLERGSKADYLAFYQDKSLAEALYGLDFEGLIALWQREHLDAAHNVPPILVRIAEAVE